jgi:hypothetical protein
MGHKGSWAKIFLDIINFFVLPILAGMVLGLTVGLYVLPLISLSTVPRILTANSIGVLVGTFVVSLWRTFFRRSDSRGASEHEVAVGDEKFGLLEEQYVQLTRDDEVESPPAYVDAGLAAAGDEKTATEV